MDKIQGKKEIEEWYSQPDPWGYEKNADDENRRAILLAEIPTHNYKKVLDIGCGEGFLTQHLPGQEIIGIDISRFAIERARKNMPEQRFTFQECSIFDIDNIYQAQKFDLILITGVLYPQYIGSSELLIMDKIDSLLAPRGILISVHIDEWYRARFQYFLSKQIFYSYRDHSHCLEVYVK